MSTVRIWSEMTDLARHPVAVRMCVFGTQDEKAIAKKWLLVKRRTRDRMAKEYAPLFEKYLFGKSQNKRPVASEARENVFIWPSRANFS